MLTQLKNYCRSVVPLEEAELALLDDCFEQKTFGKKDFLLRDTQVCNFIAFLSEGCVRHFHVKDGLEKSCDISFENSWVTDFHSFNSGVTARMNLQALEPTTALLIRKDRLQALYARCGKYETFGRMMAEGVAQRASDIAMSLSSDKPEERFQKLLHRQPDLFQRVPQKYIADLLGVSPESLSRIRGRIFRRAKS